MGNAPSTAAHNGRSKTNRLSKPRVGNHSTPGLLSPGLTSDPNYNASSLQALPLAPDLSSDSSWPETSSADSAQSPDGSTSVPVPGGTISSNVDRSSQPELAAQTRNASVSLPPSRVNSFHAGHGSNSAIDLAPTVFEFKQNSTHARRMSSGRPATDDLRSIGACELKPFEPMPPPPPTDGRLASGFSATGDINEIGRRRGESGSIPRTNSDLALYTPMRRRSLMTPGLATRIPAPPKLDLDDVPSVTPRTQNTLESDAGHGYDDEALFMPIPSLNPDMIPRASTPCGTEYQQTGAFKLGTLRITNGSPSRSPSRSPVPLAERLDNTRGPIPELSLDPDRDVKSSQALHSGSAWLGPALGDSIGQTRHEDDDKSQIASMQLAPLVLPAIELGPFSSDFQSMQTTSKNPAMDDGLFEAEPLEYSTPEVLDVRHDLCAKSQPSSDAEFCLEELARRDSGVVASPSAEYPQKQLSKADSGYSSTLSIRSLSQTKGSNVGPSSPTMSNPPAVPEKDTKYKTHRRLRISSELRGPYIRKPPPVPQKDSPHTKKMVGPRRTHSSHPDLHFLSRPDPGTSPTSSLQDAKNSGNHIRSMSRNRKGDRDVATGHGSISGLTIDASVKTHGKVQRMLSGARAPLTVHDTHPSGRERVPSIPHDTKARLHQREGSLPTSHVEPNIKSHQSRETQATILSMGSSEIGELATSGPQKPEPPDTKLTPLSSSGSRDIPIKRKPVSMRVNTSIASNLSTGMCGIPLSAHNLGRTAEHQPGKQRMRRSVGDGGSAPEAVAGRANSLMNDDFPSVDCLTTDSRVASQEQQHTSPRAVETSRPREKVYQPSSPPVSMRTRKSSRQVLAASQPRSVLLASGASGQVEPTRRSSRESERTTADDRATPGRNGTHLPQDVKFGFRQKLRLMSANTSILKSHELLLKLRGSPEREEKDPKKSPAEDECISGWQVQTYHGTDLVRVAFDVRNVTRSTSMSNLQDSAWPNSTDPSTYDEFKRPKLQHRVSYDGHSNLKLFCSLPNDIEYGPVLVNGQAYVADPWSGQLMSPTAEQGEWRPPHVTRSHFRNRSVGSQDKHGSRAPYRILHSYNSPAYRNAPIWG